jgi:hypothetical protein
MMEGDERDKGEGGRSRLYDTSGGDKADNVKIDFPVRPSVICWSTISSPSLIEAQNQGLTKGDRQREDGALCLTKFLQQPVLPFSSFLELSCSFSLCLTLVLSPLFRAISSRSWNAFRKGSPRKTCTLCVRDGVTREKE